MQNKIVLRSAIILLVAFVAGCDHFPSRSFRITEADNVGTGESLCNDLAGLAAVAGLIKKPPDGEGVLCVFVEDTYRTLLLGARTTSEGIVVDLQGANPGKDYDVLMADVESLLSEKYPHYALLEK